MIHYFKRKALDEFVWTAPLVQIAWRLGVSDVALRKVVSKGGHSVARARVPEPRRIGSAARGDSVAAGTGGAAGIAKD